MTFIMQNFEIINNFYYINNMKLPQKKTKILPPSNWKQFITSILPTCIFKNCLNVY
jgi:hypothetical protein